MLGGTAGRRWPAVRTPANLPQHGRRVLLPGRAHRPAALVRGQRRSLHLGTRLAGAGRWAVAFGFARKGTPPATIVQAWEAGTGRPAWQVALNLSGNRAGSIAGCTDGKV